MKSILLAGGTGYLGRYIQQVLRATNYPTRMLIRHSQQAERFPQEDALLTFFTSELTQPDTLTGCCDGIDTVITTVGITRQKEGFTYMEVDYQANLNLLEEAKRAGVRKFIYVSVLNGAALQKTKICAAKEKFVAALQQSGLDYCVIRPNGYFSDMKDFLDMAKAGRVYLFGTGYLKMNPIHGADLAEVCVRAIETTETEVNIGGPETFTHNEIARLALVAHSKPVKITHLPDWVRRATLAFLRTFTSSKVYGPLEFFLSAMAMDMVAPEYGTHHLCDFFVKEVKNAND